MSEKVEQLGLLSTDQSHCIYRFKSHILNFSFLCGILFILSLYKYLYYNLVTCVNCSSVCTHAFHISVINTEHQNYVNALIWAYHLMSCSQLLKPDNHNLGKYEVMKLIVTYYFLIYQTTAAT